MKKLLLVAAVSAATFAPAARAEFTGDVKLACEAILCLAGTGGGSACSPSLSKFFSFWKITDRFNFLNLCPSADADDNMRSLVNIEANGGGHCEAADLNRDLYRKDGPDDGGYIDDQLPAVCTALFNHPYTRLPKPTYVGEPRNGGHWE